VLVLPQTLGARRVIAVITRSLVAPIVTHLTWAVLMITAFPRP